MTTPDAEGDTKGSGQVPPDTTAAVSTSSRAAASADRYREYTKWLSGLVPLAAVITAVVGVVPSFFDHDVGVEAWLLITVVLLAAILIPSLALRVLTVKEVDGPTAYTRLLDGMTDLGTPRASTLAHAINNDKRLLSQAGVVDVVGLVQAWSEASGPDGKTPLPAHLSSIRTAVALVATERDVAKAFRRFGRTVFVAGVVIAAGLIGAVAMAEDSPAAPTEPDLDPFAPVLLVPADASDGILAVLCEADVGPEVAGRVVAGTTRHAEVLLDDPHCPSLVVSWDPNDGVIRPADDK